jgi:hypothetical protein
MWNGSFFQCITLKSLGVCIQLGHNSGDKCYNLVPSTGDDFIVIGLDGIHEIALDFCGCASAQVQYKQLLCVQWYPATISEPQTTATFMVLQNFHLLSFESKVSAYEFYHLLARCTDNSSLSKIKVSIISSSLDLSNYNMKDCYSAFMRMVHQWRNLKQLGHAGRGHNPARVDTTAEGELAVLCPTCPHPGKNLLPDWGEELLFIR